MDNLGEYLCGLAAAYPLEKYPERPPEFNLESALVNARRAVQMLHERIGMNLSESSQEVCQDASFFAEFMGEAKSGAPVRLIFSAFGQLVAIDGERILGASALDQAKYVLQELGYLYVPENMRSRSANSGCGTLGARFLGYL